ncbi:hypothetical protein LTR37_020979 [Vermiconidia calcicola]|uniref:Uncharacterized protein n=1 Tax=Vermiconidia calcicola TaxID=1690605 RepID=A0ACC3M9P0_9PEZI|nr:hypothetical protein LTR37_020979 [Vermiconidia calcicola]
MADVRNGMRLQDDDLTPDESSDAFEDAAEMATGPSRSPSRNSNVEKSEGEGLVGLGINGNGASDTTQSTADDKGGLDVDFKPKMSARLSRWISDEPVMSMAAENSTPTHSRQATAEKVPALVEGPTKVELEKERPVSPEVPSAAPQDSRPVSGTAITGPSLEQELGGDSSASPPMPHNDQTPVRPSHSRRTTSETAPALVAKPPEEDTELSVPPPTSSPSRHSRGHSRQITAETAPSLLPGAFTPEEERAVSLEAELTPRQPRSHSRQVTTEATPAVVAEPPTPTLESSIMAGLRSHSRNNTADAVPILAPPEREADQERSMSPTKVQLRDDSPHKMVRGLSGDVPLASPPPPSSLGRVQALESRHIGDQQTSTSPPPPGGLMRSASTRMGAFLGRMGSIRKPGRSPPGPRQEGRFAVERRNTSQSITSITSNGDERLATISDGPEGENGTNVRPSLQDQFRNLRKQEEYSIPGANGYIGDEEKTPAMRTTSEAGFEIPASPAKESPDFRSRRASSTVSGMKSPPMNPTLPPGTASGMTAGPSEGPQDVDWDLWQAVVYEGPSALAKSSGDELRLAIASGIPPAIRGVVWQVLAESKNAELENVYRTLKARGTAGQDQLPSEPQRPESLFRQASQNNVNGTVEREERDSEVSSSRASIRSVSSTPATSNMASPPPSAQGDELDLKGKLMLEKQKREVAALSKLEKAIKRDLGTRTSYSKFTQAAGLQDGLFGVCKAYALFDEGVGYAQGMNFIAMPLLFNMTEEEAFTLLVRLMSKYDVRSMFTGDMSGLHLRLYQFERLLEDHDPALYCHLRRRNVGPQLYATQWFLTLFAYRFPLQLVLRVYDLVFSEGLTAILKFGLVLMQHNRDTLLAMKDMGHLTNFLKEKVFDVYIDRSPSASSLLDSGFFGSVTGGADKELYRADEMVRDACEIQISDSTLAQYTAEWDESQRQTHEVSLELETLRATSQHLTHKIRTLEERSQQQDNEHVTLASDLVRIKLENDTLQDENEGLKVKVAELEKMVDALPAEVEARLKEEMDRILTRNGEVQGENRVLKEEMGEMEQQLVMAKMARAETQSDYDALIQKWASVQSLLSGK